MAPVAGRPYMSIHPQRRGLSFCANERQPQGIFAGSPSLRMAKGPGAKENRKSLFLTSRADRTGSNRKRENLRGMHGEAE